MKEWKESPTPPPICVPSSPWPLRGEDAVKEDAKQMLHMLLVLLYKSIILPFCWSFILCEISRISWVWLWIHLFIFKLPLFNYHYFKELYKVKRELTRKKHRNRNRRFLSPISLCAVLLLCFFLSTHSYQLKFPPSPFQLNILHRKHEFIFVSQTFLGWGLLGNGCMKDVSRARRDVWFWKQDKNSQTPTIVFLFKTVLTIER